MRLILSIHLPRKRHYTLHSRYYTLFTQFHVFIDIINPRFLFDSICPLASNWYTDEKLISAMEGNSWIFVDYFVGVRWTKFSSMFDCVRKSQNFKSILYQLHQFRIFCRIFEKMMHCIYNVLIIRRYILLTEMSKTCTIW